MCQRVTLFYVIAIGRPKAKGLNSQGSESLQTEEHIKELGVAQQRGRGRAPSVAISYPVHLICLAVVGFFVCLFRPAPSACGSSQARG